MPFPFTQEKWNQILYQLYKRVLEDHQFYELCLSDAHGAIDLLIQQEIPHTFDIHFVDQSEELVYMLPFRQVNPNSKTIEEQLQFMDKMIDAYTLSEHGLGAGIKETESMEELFTSQEWKGVMHQLYKKALQEQMFYDLCLHDAYQAIEEISGKVISKDKSVRFVDPSQQLVYMLPSIRTRLGEDLTEEELAAVVGGISPGGSLGGEAWDPGKPHMGLSGL